MLAGLADADLPHEPLARLLSWSPRFAAFSREISLGVYLLQAAAKLGVAAIPHGGKAGFTPLVLAVLLPAATLVHYGVQRPISGCVTKALATRAPNKGESGTAGPAKGDP